MSALSQQYDAARVKLDQVDSNIATTKAAIAVNQAQVSKDKTILEKAAIANYVSDGAAATENPIFSNNEKTTRRGHRVQPDRIGRHQPGRGQPPHRREQAGGAAERS